MTTTSTLLFVSLLVTETGTLTVQLTHSDGTPRLVAGVTLFLADADGRPATKTLPDPTTERSWGFLPSFLFIDQDTIYAVTDGDGRATFEDLRPGDYRVLAQKWHDVDGFPAGGSNNSDDWRQLPNSVTAYGVGTATVAAGETASLQIAPVGRSRLKIDIKAEHRGNLLVVSLGQPIVSPAMSAFSFNHHLDKDVILYQHVSQTYGDIVLDGLPSDRDVTVALMAYDNNPGAGGIVARAGIGARETITVHAGWSDATPIPEPPHLEPLIQFLIDRDEPLDMVALLEIKTDETGDTPSSRHKRSQVVWRAAVDRARETINVPDYGEVLIAELIVADGIARQRVREVSCEL